MLGLRSFAAAPNGRAERLSRDHRQAADYCLSPRAWFTDGCRDAGRSNRLLPQEVKIFRSVELLSLQPAMVESCRRF